MGSSQAIGDPNPTVLRRAALASRTIRIWTGMPCVADDGKPNWRSGWDVETLPSRPRARALRVWGDIEGNSYDIAGLDQ